MNLSLIPWIVLPVLALAVFWFLLRTHPAFGKFIWNMFCDAQGKPGLGRVASWVALHCVILWNTHIVWKTEKVPDMATLIGEVLFVGGLYSIEKIPEIVAAWKGNPLLAAKMSGPGDPPVSRAE
jgi:hypothetical protein